MNFYDKLNTICQSKGVKITPTVLQCGGTKGIIGGWQKGASPNSDIVIKLSGYLNVSTDYLLGLDDIPNRKQSNAAQELTAAEQELLSLFNRLSDNEKQRELGRMETIIEFHSSENKLPK